MTNKCSLVTFERKVFHNKWISEVVLGKEIHSQKQNKETNYNVCAF